MMMLRFRTVLFIFRITQNPQSSNSLTITFYIRPKRYIDISGNQKGLFDKL